ncbi:mitochondrial 54S ribosomal protein YmL23 [Kalaharituber pfeilii]|nr:mitochondrial 54S ribosomal protein YmL23 [Kalaharituber pfeilii]
MSTTIGRTALAYSRSWHYIDVGTDPRSLGRIASSIAMTLMGKHKPIYDPSTDCGDYVVAVGCHDIRTTGKKRFQKKYYSHSTRPGSLKELTMDKMIAKFGGAEILRKAVSGMLPKNKLRNVRLSRLKAYDGLGHPHNRNILKMNVLSPNAQLHQSKTAKFESSESQTPVQDALTTATASPQKMNPSFASASA